MSLSHVHASQEASPLHEFTREAWRVEARPKTRYLLATIAPAAQRSTCWLATCRSSGTTIPRCFAPVAPAYRFSREKRWDSLGNLLNNVAFGDSELGFLEATKDPGQEPESCWEYGMFATSVFVLRGRSAF